MILEGIVTSLDLSGVVNLAPMGPRLSPPYIVEVGTLVDLRPFKTSRTYANLKAHPEAVLHVTDDVLVLARAAIGEVADAETFPAVAVRGAVLAGACRAYELRVQAVDEAAERTTFRAAVRHVHRMRDFFGLNRALFAVVEAAILATRVHLLPMAQIEADLDRLAVLVEKTGGPREAEALALLRQHVESRGGPRADLRE